MAWRVCLFVIASGSVVSAQPAREFRQTLATSLAQPVSLDVDLQEGDLEVAYRRDGEVSVSARGQTGEGDLPEGFFATLLSVTSAGNQVDVRQRRPAGRVPRGVKIVYRIDVPYRTEVHSFVGSGKQRITGIMGPVLAEVNDGDLEVSYVSKAVVARATAGDLDLQLIGGPVEARTARGRISCSRATQGVSAETGDGDISLMVVGPSQAKVREGAGNVDVGGARGTLVVSTDGGDLHVKAVPHDDWRLASGSGTIRIELPPAARFDLDALTDSGSLMIRRDDLEKPGAGVHRLAERANGGGRRIEVRTETGTIVVR